MLCSGLAPSAGVLPVLRGGILAPLLVSNLDGDTTVTANFDVFLLLEDRDTGQNATFLGPGSYIPELETLALCVVVSCSVLHTLVLQHWGLGPIRVPNRTKSHIRFTTITTNSLLYWLLVELLAILLAMLTSHVTGRRGLFL